MNLINRQNVRKLALDISKRDRADKFKAVSADFLERVEGQLKLLVVKAVNSHPSVGKTLK